MTRKPRRMAHMPVNFPAYCPYRDEPPFQARSPACTHPDRTCEWCPHPTEFQDNCPLDEVDE